MTGIAGGFDAVAGGDDGGNDHAARMVFLPVLRLDVYMSVMEHIVGRIGPLDLGGGESQFKLRSLLNEPAFTGCGHYLAVWELLLELPQSSGMITMTVGHKKILQMFRRDTSLLHVAENPLAVNAASGIKQNGFSPIVQQIDVAVFEAGDPGAGVTAGHHIETILNSNIHNG